MRNKRTNKLLLLTVIIILILSILNCVNAAVTEMIASSSNYLKAGDEVKVTFSIKNIEVEEGIDAIIAKLQYDEEVFEQVKEDDLVGCSKWNVMIYNEDNKAFTMLRNSAIKEDNDLLTVTFKAKTSISKDETTISLIDISASGGVDDIDISTASVVIKKEIVKEDDGNNTTSNNVIDNSNNIVLSNEILNITNTTNSVVNNTDNVTNTNISNVNNTAIDKLPQTGENILVFGGVVTVIILSIYFLVRYKEM